MRPGYLSIQTHDAHRGRIRILVTAHQPAIDFEDPQASPRVRYTSRFNDREAALMHTHEFLKRRLLDPDAHLYRVDLAHAIAAVESVDLRHRTVYWDPQLDTETRAEIDHIIAANRALLRRKERFFRTLGYIGIGILLFNLFFLSLA